MLPSEAKRAGPVKLTYSPRNEPRRRKPGSRAETFGSSEVTAAVSRHSLNSERFGKGGGRILFSRDNGIEWETAETYFLGSAPT